MQRSGKGLEIHDLDLYPEKLEEKPGKLFQKGRGKNKPDKCGMRMRKTNKDIYCKLLFQETLVKIRNIYGKTTMRNLLVQIVFKIIETKVFAQQNNDNSNNKKNPSGK